MKLRMKIPGGMWVSFRWFEMLSGHSIYLTVCLQASDGGCYNTVPV